MLSQVAGENFRPQPEKRGFWSLHSLNSGPSPPPVIPSLIQEEPSLFHLKPQSLTAQGVNEDALGRQQEERQAT